ncbi:MAG: hypothetical protein ACTHJZ_23930 [Trinickia sp.]|uniref:hypothetical protein n=1 Tax=Trinickia sp. TaxID=2571163 RepID=UPI003F7FB7FC
MAPVVTLEFGARADDDIEWNPGPRTHEDGFIENRRTHANAAQGQLRLVPEGDARKALADDYGAMLDDAILLGDPATFDQLMQVCADLEGKVNRRDV